MSPRLEVRGVTKQFPGVLANDAVDFSVEPGEIHALLGENGAGKSTLVKMIYGVLHPDSGAIRWDGEAVVIDDPSAARALGIGMVFQHFSLFEAMTVLENIALGMDKPGDMVALADRVRQISREYGLPLDPDRGVYSLSVGERQRIEIVRCLLQEPRLLIMDEPTSVLTPQEVERLFEALRKKYKRIIVDTPPVMPFADADAVGVLSDGVLMVARSGKTRSGLFQRAIQSVTSTRILGVIFNEATFNLADRGTYPGYEESYYDYYDKDRSK